MDPLDPLFDDADYDAALARDNRERERALWGRLLKDRTLLQTRGYGVWKDRRRIVVDGRRLTKAQFVLLVSREQRLRP